MRGRKANSERAAVCQGDPDRKAGKLDGDGQRLTEATDSLVAPYAMQKADRASLLSRYSKLWLSELRNYAGHGDEGRSLLLT